MIIIGCPVQNRDWILPYYLDHIYKLDYDKKEIILVFLVNDSLDNTLNILLDFQRKHESEYNGIIINNAIYGLKPDDRNKGRNSQSFHQFTVVRNRWIEIIKGINADWVFSIDSDILVPSNSLKKLISNNKDICSMLVNNSLHRMGFGKDCFNIMKLGGLSKDKYAHIMEFELNSLFQVDVTGAAYLIRKNVFNNTTYQYHNQGEDIGFCRNARMNGYEIWCDSSLYANHIMDRKYIKEIYATK